MTVRSPDGRVGSTATRRVRDTARLVRGNADMTGGIDELVAGFTKAVDAFGDRGFSKPGGTVELRHRIPEAQCVRIELPGTRALQLASVLIDADGIEDPAGHTKRTISSASKVDQQTLQQGLLFDRDNRAVAVQTKRQKQPWLEITFDQPVTLRKITLRNIADPEKSLGAVRGLQVLVRSGAGTWDTIYDEVASERAFVRAVERRYAGQTLPQRAGTRIGRIFKRTSDDGERPESGEDVVPVDRGADLMKILTNVWLGDYADVESYLRRVDLPQEQKSRFRARVNEQIAPRQREWSLHGIKRTFRFWSEQEKRDYVGFAVDVVRCLQDLNENVSLGFGTVLGLVRDRDLIAHDDDADVIIGFEPEQAATLEQGRELIKQCLQDHGYIISKDRLSHYWVEAPGIRRKLDAFAGIFEGDGIAWYPGRRGVLTRQMVFPPTYIERFGHSCPVPRETERYLEQIYGSDWRQPNPNFRHRKSEIRQQYDSLRG